MEYFSFDQAQFSYHEKQLLCNIILKKTWNMVYQCKMFLYLHTQRKYYFHLITKAQMAFFLSIILITK